MGAAAELLTGKYAQEKRREMRRCRDLFVQELRELRWPTSVIGPEFKVRHPGNASICFHGFVADEILGALQPRVAASSGSACTTGIPEPSHVLRAIGLDGEDADSCIRFSLGFETTDEDVEKTVRLIAEVLGKLATAEIVSSG